MRYMAQTVCSGGGMVIPESMPSMTGSVAPSGNLNVNCCRSEEKIRKSSMRANDSPAQTRRPEVNKHDNIDNVNIRNECKY